MSLIEEMMKNLPITVYHTSALAEHLSEKGVKIDENKCRRIKSLKPQ